MAGLPFDFVPGAIRSSECASFAARSSCTYHLQFYQYSTAFILGLEGSLYPIGFGFRGFVYLPVLAKFKNVRFSVPSNNYHIESIDIVRFLIHSLIWAFKLIGSYKADLHCDTGCQLYCNGVNYTDSHADCYHDIFRSARTYSELI